LQKKEQPLSCPIFYIGFEFFFCKGVDYFFAGQVLRPISVYSGQKLMNEVNVNTPANTSNTIPNVPVTVLVKYSTANNAATISRMMRSAEPMFFFI
jgi:hypothetical protein